MRYVPVSLPDQRTDLRYSGKTSLTRSVTFRFSLQMLRLNQNSRMQYKFRRNWGDF